MKVVYKLLIFGIGIVAGMNLVTLYPNPEYVAANYKILICVVSAGAIMLYDHYDVGGE